MTDQESEREPGRPDLPAGLDQAGRDEKLVRDADVHPSGMRADSRASASGTALPHEPEPAAQEGESGRVAHGAQQDEPAE